MKAVKYGILSRCSVLLIAILCTTVAAMAAGGVSKQINDIKRAGNCFFAESTAPSKAEAKKSATQMLAYYINDYIKDNGLSHEQVTETSIPGVKYLDMKRGSNIRVFAYVEKAVILNGETPAPAHEEADPEPAPAPAPSPAPAPAPAPAATTAEPAEDVPAVPVQTEPSYDTGDENLSVTTSAPDPNSDPVTRTYVAALEQLIGAGKLENVFSVLNRLKAEYVVKRFGPYHKCANKTWAFWMIFDSTGENLEGFLSPGNDGERLNIVTDVDNDDLNNYLGGKDKVAIWFEFR